MEPEAIMRQLRLKIKTSAMEMNYPNHQISSRRDR